MATGKIDFNLTGIGALLNAELYKVPIYQRSYAWDEADVSDFWDDLSRALTADDPEYFLGTVVLTPSQDDERVVIIDGQQRLATTTIFLAALRGVAEDQGRVKLAESISQDFLYAYDYDEDEAVPRLVLNAEDDDFFRTYVVDDADVEATRESHERLSNAYDLLTEFASEDVESYGNQAEQRLNDWLKFLKNQVRVMSITVPSESDAFMIFETLNARGAELTVGDLLKNYLFGRAGRRLDVVRGSWVAALAYLDISAENQQFIDFLRHYWSSIHGLVRERDLYRSIRDNINSQAQAVRFGGDLEEAARLYAALSNSGDDYWVDYGTATRANVDTLLRLELQQHRPLLLAVMQHFSKAELKKALRSLVSWSVRGLIVGGIGGGTAERTYCDAAVEVRNGNIKTTKDLLGAVSNIVPQDSEFEESFATARITKARIARYLLLGLEREHQNDPEAELVPNADESQVNLEHILPQNAKEADWPMFKKEEVSPWSRRIGNLALLAVGPNGKIGNKPWSTKKPVLAASKLRLTKKAAAKAKWTRTEIAARQKDLAKLAVKTWPRVQ
jgi:succinylglutamate desuccinylase